MEFAGWHLLERRRMENIINTAGGVQDTLIITHVADIELQLAIGIALAHVILLLLVTAENTNFSDVGIEEAFENGVAERTGATCN
ncbi:hypothetical protein D3C80_2038900 [compost metagenome]